ncbi:MAG: hypothetical protein VXZ82_25550 [Planctomycetota bacterium]|nr:hypothetical protein [Planctomycetota bacterium]
MQKQPEWHQTWPAIIIALFFCWPIGLYFLVSRLQHDKSTMMVAGKLFKVIGVGFLIFCGLGVLGALSSGDIPAAIILVIFGAGGFALFRKGNQMLQKREQTRQYINLIVNQQHTSVDSIASLTQQTDVMTVFQEIQDLCNNGFLPGYRLNPFTRMIERVQQSAAKSTLFSDSTAPAPIPFTCHACGANNDGIPDAKGVIRCEYCDTPKKKTKQ